MVGTVRRATVWPIAPFRRRRLAAPRDGIRGPYDSNVTAGLGSPISSHPRNFACPPRRLPPSQPTRALLAATFARAWRLLLEAAPALDRAESFRFDVIDLGRQVLAANFSEANGRFEAAREAGDATAIAVLAKTLLRMIDDYDRLLSSSKYFLLGPWIADARSWAADERAKDALEFNARNQLTLWGPTGQISDYAKKEWGGLVRSYYRPRWALYLEMAQRNASQAEYCATVLREVELPWQKDFKSSFPVKPEEDAIAVAREMARVYAWG